MSVVQERYGKWQSVVINFFWIPLFFQDAALPAITVPAVLVKLAPHNHVAVLAVIIAIAAFVSMIVPPIAGAISDRLRQRGVPRRAPILLGAGLDIVSLLLMAQAHTLSMFVVLFIVATFGANISLAAYQALIPDAVPQASWGLVSGVRSVAMVVGTALGLGMAMGTYPSSTFIGLAAGLGAGVLTLFAVAERAILDQPEEHAHISDWNDFTIVFLARAFLAFGMSLLMTFVYLFFNDVLHVANASVGTGLVAVASLGGAVVSGIALGVLSDRISRKIVVALCGIPMTLAAAGFAIAPQPQLMYAFAVLFGIGFGGIMSTGWALAMDSVPQLRDVARDLGIWGIAQNFPQVVAPLVGWSILGAYHSSIAGYQALFFCAAASFLIASAIVLAVGKHPVVPWWGTLLRTLAAVFVVSYTGLAYRIRHWGRLPSSRPPALLIANHQVELDLMHPFAWLILHTPWRNPVIVASAKLMYEPGFMAVRIPWLWRVLKNVNFGWLFEGMGMLPLENELQSRSIARWAWQAQRQHGVLPLRELFKPAAIEGTGFEQCATEDLFTSVHFKRAQETYVRLSDLNVQYRKEAFDEMKQGIERDLQRFEDAVRRGATFFVTPEGEYTKTGEMLPFRGIWDRMLPHVEQIFLAAISYDPFVDKRLSEFYRILPASSKARALDELKAARPVTTSALLGEWLAARTESFTEEEASSAIDARLRSLPAQLFIEPRLARDPGAMVRRALQHLCSLGILHRLDSRYRVTEMRGHPKFPGVQDIIAYQARFLSQTLGALTPEDVRDTIPAAGRG
jgi:MFS family permease